ncbi:hypothetical protein EJ04DRAFT_513525 [Polyplosphaeria fusca]|uniref:LysM domain-containing protein n=1 Tax=Polyplosphaeria fusca TaxID=682080 RepID=A0A9P4V008_9PLEO|nr:hypothetical protein EJ04DRAFT_513525 [Polyplosphaeria fusca]
MVATSFVLAASSFAALSYGAPVRRNAGSLVERAEAFSSYTNYGGDGSPNSGWPAQSEWQSFDDLFKANSKLITASCSQFNVADTTETEMGQIKDAITAAASSSGVDAAFILAIMMQESKGCVRVPTTNYGVRNPGLMQSHDGSATCNEGTTQNPCPQDTIESMIMQGAGVGVDFGLKQAIAQSAASDVSQYYKGARIYNSGSVDSSGNLGAGIATHCYASDVANRLRGWTDEASACEEGSIGGMTGSTGNTGNTGNTETPPANQTQDGNVDQEPAEPATTNAPISTPAKPYSGAKQGCAKWYSVKTGDNCDAVSKATGVSFDQLKQLNTGLDSDCTNLWLGSDYCVGA